MTGSDWPVTGTTQCYPLIGHPVDQVLTPPLINEWFAEQGVDAAMFAIDIEPSWIDGFFQLIRGWRNCGGCSVTVPHKQAASRAMDDLTPRAAAVGAVNIVRRTAEGHLLGDMTDGSAFVAALESQGFKPAGAKVLLAGAGGGAGLAIALALGEAGVAQLCLQEPDAVRKARASSLLSDTFPDLVIEESSSAETFDLAVNASPLGMGEGDPLPFDPSVARHHGLVADIVTKPATTPLLASAKQLGFATQSGTAMAQAQLPLQLRHLGLWPASRSPARETSHP